MNDPLTELPGIKELMVEWTPARVAEVAYKHPQAISVLVQGWQAIKVALYVFAIRKSNLEAARRRGEQDMMSFAAAFRASQAEVDQLMQDQFTRLTMFADLVAGRET